MNEKNPETTDREAASERRVFSAIQPSGAPTLGNYLGALKNWKSISDEYENCAFAVADLHAITVRQEPETLRRHTLEMYALLLALGLSPEKDIIFIQSHVPSHSQLAWLLNCYTQFGEMSRMTQFKDKSKLHSDNVNLGLFAYPALMAADILLYQANYVPVGADQKQHLEIARDIAVRFNGIYGRTFSVPEPLIYETGARIMSLSDPTRKMSKSDPNPKGFISVLDDSDTVVRKLKSAVTDSLSEIKFAEGRDGINNLISIYSCCSGRSTAQIEAEFEGKGYGEFKSAVSDAVISCLEPLQKSFYRLLEDRSYLEECMKKGAFRAAELSERTLRKAMKKIGLYATEN